MQVLIGNSCLEGIYAVSRNRIVVNDKKYEMFETTDCSTELEVASSS